jgi:hypothetical protein
VIGEQNSTIVMFLIFPKQLVKAFEKSLDVPSRLFERYLCIHLSEPIKKRSKFTTIGVGFSSQEKQFIN